MQAQKPINIPANAFPPPLMPAVLRETFLPDPPKSNWATLNLILAIWGYSFLGALLSPLSVVFGLEITDSWMVNYPIRAVQIVVALYCIFILGKRSYGTLPWTRVQMFLMFVLLMDYSRCFFDWATNNNNWLLGTNWDMSELYVNPWKFWSYKVVDFLSFISVVKTIHLVNFDKFFKWMLWGCFFGCFFLIFTLRQQVAESEYLSNQSIEGGRFDVGVSMHTLSLGSYGMRGMMFAGYYFLEKTKGKVLLKIFSLAMVVLCGYVCLKSGSRGVFIELFAVVAFYLMTRFRYMAIGAPIAVVVGGILWLLRYQVVELLGLINPTIKVRLLSTLDEGNTSGRTDLWADYWKVITDNPILGAHATHGAHNQLLDCFTEFGLFLGWVQFAPAIIAIVFSWKLLKSKTADWWPVIFMVGSVFHGIVGAGFYQGGNFLLVSVAIFILNKINSGVSEKVVANNFNRFKIS